MKRYVAVQFAVRLKVVAKLLSQLYGLLAGLTLVPGLVSLIAGSQRTALAYGLVVAVLAACCWVGRWLPQPARVQTNEALATVALLFVSASLLMAVPVTTYGVSFADAWFEAVSGVTTTGLSTISMEGKPWSFLFARGWTQWIGGVGVVVLALAVFALPGAAARGLGFSSQETSNTVGGTRGHARRVVIVYVILTAAGIALLLLAGASPLDAVVHCMAAVSTGGFANYGDSLASLPAGHIMVVNLLCIAGAISFHVYYLSIVLRTRQTRLDNQFYGLVVTLLLTVLVVWTIAHLTAADVTLLDVVSLIVSAQTTAGFATTDVASLPAWLLVVLVGAMFIGGGLGSTSGGVKLGRVLFMLRQARLHLARASMPARTYTRHGGSRSEVEDMLQDVMAVVSCFVAVLFVSWMVFVTMGYPPLASLFEVTSALATAGLSAGITDASLPLVLKMVLCADMLFGRVEVVALLIVMLPRTWIGRRRGLV